MEIDIRCHAVVHVSVNRTGFTLIFKDVQSSLSRFDGAIFRMVDTYYEDAPVIVLF